MNQHVSSIQPMLNQKIFLVALFAIVLTIVMWLLSQSWRHPQVRTASEGNETLPITVDAQVSKSDQAANLLVEASPSKIPMPSENAPLVDTLKELVQLSNSGSAAASMRLFRDLKKCDLRRGSQSVLNNVYYHRPGQTDAEYTLQIKQELNQVPALKKALDQLDSTDSLCDGISADVIESRGDYLRQAALQNDPEAMVCYATSYELGPKYLSDAWFDYVAQWQQDAPYFAQQALDAGQPGILAALIDAYMPDDPGRRRLYSLSEILDPDPKLAYALSLVYMRLAQGANLQQAQIQLAQLSGSLQPDQIASAQALADALSPRFQRESVDQRELTVPCAEFRFLPGDSIMIQGGP